MILKIINILVYFAFYASGILVTGSPSIFNDPKEYYTLAFFTETTTHMHLFGIIIYQFSRSGERIVIDGMSWRFPLLCILNAVYMNLLLTRHYILAFIFAYVVNFTSANTYLIVMSHFAESWGYRLFVRLPFCIYHASTSSLVVLTALEALGVNAQTEHTGIWTKVFVSIALYLLADSAATHASLGDFAGSNAISCALWSIAYQQTPNLFIKCLAGFFATKASSNYAYPQHMRHESVDYHSVDYDSDD